MIQNVCTCLECGLHFRSTDVCAELTAPNHRAGMQADAPDSAPWQCHTCGSSPATRPMRKSELQNSLTVPWGLRAFGAEYPQNSEFQHFQGTIWKDACHMVQNHIKSWNPQVGLFTAGSGQTCGSCGANMPCGAIILSHAHVFGPTLQFVGDRWR